MPKMNPKHNPAHVERTKRKRARNHVSARFPKIPQDDEWMDETGDRFQIMAGINNPAWGVGSRNGRPRCGLCGKTTNLTKTECCGQWICDDEDQYVLFSFDTNSCHRNHDRYTLCANHDHEGHEGKWQECPEGRGAF